MKKCWKCQETKDESVFYKNRKSKDGLGVMCKPCSSSYMAAYYQKNKRHLIPKNIEAKRARSQKKERHLYLKDLFPSHVLSVYENCRGADAKKKVLFDLTRGDVASMVALPCSYCGDTNARMTLDRIDNSKGHTKGNVVPACYRCNMIRRNMPYEAWLLIAPAIKTAREAGAFGDWSCGPHSNSAQASSNDRTPDFDPENGGLIPPA